MDPKRHDSVNLEGLHSIFEHSVDGILFSAPDGRILAANPAAASILRMNASEICERGRSGLADPTDGRWAAGVHLRKETGSFFGDLRMIRGDGSILTAEVSSSVFVDEAGEARHASSSAMLRNVSPLSSDCGSFQQEKRF